MDEHEKMDDKFQESSEQPPRNQEDNSEETIDQHQAGFKEGRSAEKEPTVQLQLIKEVETGCSEEASSRSLLGIFANPCSLLQYLLRACAVWCRGQRGAFVDGPKPQQAAAVAPEAVPAPANATGQGDSGGEKANYFYMQEVVTRVWAVRRGRAPPGRPDHPRGGSGENGGIHN